MNAPRYCSSGLPISLNSDRPSGGHVEVKATGHFTVKNSGHFVVKDGGQFGLKAGGQICGNFQLSAGAATEVAFATLPYREQGVLADSESTIEHSQHARYGGGRQHSQYPSDNVGSSVD